MSSVLAIDPGSEQSGYVVYDGEKLLCFGLASNTDVVHGLSSLIRGYQHEPTKISHLAIEFPRARGMLASNDLFVTCRWVGRFAQKYYECSPYAPVTFVDRKDVKMCICESPRAKDTNIRQALIDRWGGKAKAIGLKATPGPLYGVKKDIWSALAVAVTWWETMRPS